MMTANHAQRTGREPAPAFVALTGPALSLGVLGDSMRTLLSILLVVSLFAGTLHAASPPATFLLSDDPVWAECLAHKTDFKKSTVTADELLARLYGIPHWTLHNLDDAFKRRTIKLPAVVVDQRTALWELHQQTGVVITVSRLKPEGLRGTLFIEPPAK